MQELEILEYIREQGGATTDEIAIHFTGSSQQHLFTSKVNKMVKAGIIYKSIDNKITSNQGIASVYREVKDIKNYSTVSLFEQENHEATIMDIDYSTAKYIYEHCMNKNNRRISPSSSSPLAKLKADMTDYNFNPSSMLMFDTAGTLIDGHHRITAQVQTKRDVTYCVQLGCDKSWVHDVDTGKKRSLGDSLNMALKDKDLYTAWDLNTKQEELVKYLALHWTTNVTAKLTKPRFTGSGMSNRVIKEWVYEEGNHRLCTSFLSCIKNLRGINDPQINKVTNKAGTIGYRALMVALAEITLFYGEDLAVDYITTVFGLSGTKNTCDTSRTVKFLYDTVQEKTKAKRLDVRSAELLIYGYIINGFTLTHLKNHLNISTTSSKLGKIVKGEYVNINPLYLYDN
tara:strand:+ start:1072 stop:2271 length:1200 start_codon:yes stop_codon:yes gene_type:complete